MGSCIRHCPFHVRVCEIGPEGITLKPEMAKHNRGVRRGTMPENLSSILHSTEPTLLTTGWGRTEGPLWHAAGYVTFVDLAGSRLLRWDASGQVSVVREHTGEGNGCTLDRQRRLIMCEGADHRRITRMDADGTVA